MRETICDVSKTFLELANAARSKVRIIAQQGGTSSGKTYSGMQWLISAYGLNRTKKAKLRVDIMRKTLAELTDSSYEDFMNIIQDMGIYNIKSHVRSKDRLSYQIGNTLFRFRGLDKPQKKRGPRREVLYINEANGLSLEDWIQISKRTSKKIFLDYNPSEEFWFHDLYINNPEKKEGINYILLKSTYKDNVSIDTGDSFLPEDQIQDIEDLIQVDDYYYKVYVLGELADFKGKIFTNLITIDREGYLNAKKLGEVFYGLDFGYEHYTVLTECVYYKENVYVCPVYMERKKKDEDLIKWMQENNINKSAPIYCDHAYPASIRRIQEKGFQARKANKDVKDGIRFCQGFKVIYVYDPTQRRVAWQQASRYKYRQTTDGNIIEEPVKMEDDFPDSMRYGLFTHLRKRIRRIGVSY